MRRVAVVGSEEVYWTPETRKRAVQEIKSIFYHHVPMDFNIPMWRELRLVSGGCPKGGVDIWAEVIADFLGMDKRIYEPDVMSWKGTKGQRGYKERNMKIAEDCDLLYCIDPENRDWSGGRWTMNYAEKIGKKVHFIAVREEE